MRLTPLAKMKPKDFEGVAVAPRSMRNARRHTCAAVVRRAIAFASVPRETPGLGRPGRGIMTSRRMAAEPRGDWRVEVNVDLREGDGDVVLLEGGPDRLTHLGPQHTGLPRLRGPDG